MELRLPTDKAHMWWWVQQGKHLSKSAKQQVHLAEEQEKASKSASEKM
jgi:hypothetical protein